ncbi:hypothetical protein Lal_00024217 [Lupinus albus]|nr:hypothetical protein Lal_00024217 [Lupinus albus]
MLSLLPQDLKSLKNVLRLNCFSLKALWNSTNLMLEHSEKFEKAFDRFYDQESDFHKWFGEDDKGKRKSGPPTEKD